MKRLIKVLSVIGVLAVAVVVAGVAVLSSLDFNEYKGVIAEEAKKATGRDLTIAGDLKLDISLTPSIYVNGVTFANAEWGTRPEMVKLERLEAEVALLPLLSRELDVKRLVLVGLDMLAETDKQGRGNWEFAVAGPAAEDKPQDGQAGILPVVRKVHFKDLNLTYRDGRTEQETRLKLSGLDLSAASASAPLALSLTGEVNGEQFSGEGTLASVKQLTAAGQVPLGLTFQALGVRIGIKGEVGDMKAMSGLALTVSAVGDSVNGTLARAAKFAPQAADLRLPELGPFDISATVTGSAEKPGLANLKAKVGRAETAEFQASGTIADVMGQAGVDLQVVAKAADPTALAAGAGVDIPKLPALFAATRLSDAAGGFKFDKLDLKLGKSDVEGLAVIRMDGPRPNLSAELTSRVLNLDELLPKDSVAPPAETSKPASDGRVFSADPLPLGALKAADADVKVRVSKVTVNKIDVRDLQVALRLTGGNLTVKPFRATVSDGKISGGLALGGDQPVPPLDLSLKVEKLDYGKLLAMLGQEQIATGMLDVDLTAKGAGVSPRAIMAGLNGKLRIVSENGRIESGLLNIASADILSALPMVDSKGDKDMRCLVADFEITKGQAKSRAMVLETGGLSVVGVGGVNLQTEGLDLTFEPRAKKTSLLSAALVPVAVKGTLAQPDPRINAADVATNTVGSALSGAAAIMTLGASTVVQSAFNRAKNTDETDYCQLALAGKVVTPSAGEAKKSPGTGAGGGAGAQPPAQGESKPAGGVGGALEGIGKGIGGGLKGLFGN